MSKRRFTDEERKQRHRESCRRYYKRKRQNPEFLAHLARKARDAHARRKSSDPDYVEARRVYSIERYHKRVKTDPEQLKRKQKYSREAQQRLRAKRNAEVKLKLQELLGGKCVKCGNDDPRLLDFDHIDPMTKTMMLSQKLHLPWERLVEEARKCQLLCANCHRIKNIEQKELNSYIRRNREYRNEYRGSNFY